MSRVLNVDAPNIPKRKTVPPEHDVKTWILSLLDRTRQGLTKRVEANEITGTVAGHHMDCVVAVVNHIYQFYADQKVLLALHDERNELLERVQELSARAEEAEEQLAISIYNSKTMTQQEVQP